MIGIKKNEKQVCIKIIAVFVAIIILSGINFGVAYLNFVNMETEIYNLMPSTNEDYKVKGMPMEVERWQAIRPWIIITNLIISILLIVILTKMKTNKSNKVSKIMTVILYIALIMIPNIVLYLTTNTILSEKIKFVS